MDFNTCPTCDIKTNDNKCPVCWYAFVKQDEKKPTKSKKEAK